MIIMINIISLESQSDFTVLYAELSQKYINVISEKMTKSFY